MNISTKINDKKIKTACENSIKSTERVRVGQVDLHSHSTASDGSLSPTELVETAYKAGLKVLALTDHDTIDGLKEFHQAGKKSALQTVGGVEISLEHPGTMHLLGLNVTENNIAPKALEKLKVFRVERNLKLLDVLGHQGYILSWDRLLEASHGGQMGRPHFADLLLKKGYFKTREEVFDKLLGKGRPGYVNKKRMSPKGGISMLNDAGWAPVLAHPISLGLDCDQWPPFLKQLSTWGLCGLEVYHPSHPPETTSFFKTLAENFKLVPTAGSDFHGLYRTSLNLDWVLINSPYGEEMLENLKAKSK